MKFYEFVKWVAEMRAAQREFFEKHNQRQLEKAKRLEKRVDTVIAETLKTVPEQTGMFEVTENDRNNA